MIVVFVIVLVVFGPHKLPELARGLGKLLAEFRKASTDFRSAFEQEMRDLERQAVQAERKKAAEAAASSAASALVEPAPAPAQAESNSSEGAQQAEALNAETPVILPSAEAVPRSSDGIAEEPIDKSAGVAEPSPDPTHGHQQPV